MSHAKGSTMPVHRVACMECGTRLLRKTYWRYPRCVACRKKGQKYREARQLKKLRSEARRYRILMCASPYLSFEKLLDALRVRNPRTRAERYDLALERRNGRGLFFVSHAPERISRGGAPDGGDT